MWYEFVQQLYCTCTNGVVTDTIIYFVYNVHWETVRLRARRVLSLFKYVALRTKRVLSLSKDVPLRTKRVLSLSKDVPLRTRRVILLKTLYSDTALLVLNRTPLNIDSTLLALNCQNDSWWLKVIHSTDQELRSCHHTTIWIQEQILDHGTNYKVFTHKCVKIWSQDITLIEFSQCI